MRLLVGDVPGVIFCVLDAGAVLLSPRDFGTFSGEVIGDGDFRGKDRRFLEDGLSLSLSRGSFESADLF